jgi:hypothetical protein
VDSDNFNGIFNLPAYLCIQYFATVLKGLTSLHSTLLLTFRVESIYTPEILFAKKCIQDKTDKLFNIQTHCYSQRSELTALFRRGWGFRDHLPNPSTIEMSDITNTYLQKEDLVMLMLKQLFSEHV